VPTERPVAVGAGATQTWQRSRARTQSGLP
jgi:hypothetical protein